MSLLDKLRSVGSIKAETVATSSFFAPKDLIQTNIPIINVAFSGTLDGGLVPGLTILAGPSKHFKSNLGLVCVSSYMKKYKDSVCLFYDSEFGITPEYMLAHGIDTERVLHIPLEHIEQLKFDIMKRLSEIKKGDKVIIFIDSIGNLASKKEVDDAENEKSVADMTRAKSLKSLFRIITPHLTLKDLPCIAVNHVYEETGCLAGETLIKTANGTKMIKDITLKDVVYTKNGMKPVIHTFSPNDLSTENKRFLEMILDDGSIIRCTDNHKFLMKNGEYVSAGELNINSEFY